MAKAATPARRIAEMRFMVRSVLITLARPHGEDVDRYGATRASDAWRCSQVRELAAANDRACRLASRRTARGLERDSKDGVAPGLIGKSWGNGNLGGAVGGQNTERQWFATGGDQPEFGDAHRIGPVGHRHHRNRGAPNVDGGNKNVLALTVEGSDKRCPLRAAEIEQDG